MNAKMVQQVAKSTMEYLETQITPQISVKEIVRLAEMYMKNAGIAAFWYYDIGAFVFAGEDTTQSISGRNYVPSSRIIGENDIITIDLSPQYGGTWGDYARTIIVENGQIKKTAAQIETPEFRDGILAEEQLHQKLIEIATPNMTFDELYHLMNDSIRQLGYVNLDFNGNLGHSIETSKDDRIYIEQNNNTKLSAVEYFTFEPHIKKASSDYGFKMENIYCFRNSRLVDILRT